MHWHPNADEWAYWIKGKARVTAFEAGPRVVTLDFNPGDIGYVKRTVGHYVKNVGDTDLHYLEVFRSSYLRRYLSVRLVDPYAAGNGRSDPEHRRNDNRKVSQQQAARDA
jgi:oxalate decarboxylase/phosphoglucose isomerase-like protein (cupin superfamily)